ncbi:MAG: radical SAM protein, partial [Alphaproteobacteria bacterium]|nr:radical SAM protein [Alphaproteobacteria bacterium]
HRGFHDLIIALDKLPGLKRIRYTTSHPNDMSEDLIRAHADVAKLMPFLHLPIQSGNDRILKAMNRSYNVRSYVDIVARVFEARPDLALSGDFIVGFPGETESEFEETLAIVKAAKYASAYSFKFSARPGTPASTLAGQIALEVMDERLARLQKLISFQQHTFNLRQVGKIIPVLLERPGRHPDQLLGKSPYMQSVVVSSHSANIGEMVDVFINSAGPNSLLGTVIHQKEAYVA